MFKWVACRCFIVIICRYVWKQSVFVIFIFNFQGCKYFSLCCFDVVLIVLHLALLVVSSLIQVKRDVFTSSDSLTLKERNKQIISGLDQTARTTNWRRQEVIYCTNPNLPYLGLGMGERGNNSLRSGANNWGSGNILLSCNLWSYCTHDRDCAVGSGVGDATRIYLVTRVGLVCQLGLQFRPKAKCASRFKVPEFHVLFH